jgi:hypothetical protein
MKINFVKSIGRLRIKSLPVLFSLLLSPFAALATQSLYSNTGAINGNPPQVDATNFYNSGTWNIFTQSPYETQNTLNYTNTGTSPTSGSMIGSIGWEFDYGPLTNGGRGMSASFFNDSLASIQAVDGINQNPNGLPPTTEASYLLVSATNIVNKGTLIAGAAGEIVLNGSNVTLTRSGLGILSITGYGSGNNIAKGYFTSDEDIYDELWLQNTLTNMDSASIWIQGDAFTPDYPPIIVNEPCQDTGPFGLGFAPSLADSISITNLNTFTNIVVTNIDGSATTNHEPTSIFRQAVFVAIGDPNISGQIAFSPQSFSPNNSNLFDNVTVQLGMTATNPVTGTLQASTLFLVDTLASSTNRGLLNNINYVPGSNPETNCTDPTYRPVNYILSRLNPGFGGASGEGPPAANFLYDTSFTNQLVVADDAAYGAYIDNLTFDPYGGAVTNLPGRLNINANNLDLTKTRISAEGQVTIQATNLIGSTNAVVDCQNVSYNFGSTSGSLNVTNLAKPFVSRLNGNIYAWSGVWTNVMIQVFTNYTFTNVVSTNNITNSVPVYAPVTNYVQMSLNASLLDASQLSSTVPVTVQNLILQPTSTNMMVSDNMTVVQSLLLDGQSFTLQGGLTLSGVLNNWTFANAPNLRYFTNNGVLNIPNNAYFGSDGPTNYAEFVNNGTITAGSETINSVDFQAGGNESVNGGFYVTASSAKVQNGGINSGADVDFNAATLKLNNATIAAGGQLYLDVTGSLFDTGGSSSNVLSCNNGFDLPVKPVTGDLLGTKIETTAPGFPNVDNYWSATDFGVSSAGYSNNVALGQLVLTEGRTDSEGFASELSFHATGVSNAVYVDLLDLSKCPDFLDPTVFTIDPNFVIYYAAVKLPSTFTIPPNGGGIPQEAEEFLNGQLGGHLRWVNSFAGPNSSVDVISNGVTIAVNKALRFSKIIDSNGDGVPNYYDPYPFSTSAPFIVAGAMVQTNLPPAKAFAISWTAAANTVYQVQYRTNMISGNWQPLLNYTNTAGSSNAVTVWDTNAMVGQRFYRVSHP